MLEEKLVELLHSIAMYNDKGYIWYRHSQAESEIMRVKWRREIDQLIIQIGEGNFSPILLKELYKINVTDDDSGLYAEKVSAWFSKSIQPE